MTILVANGCSFTAGSELENIESVWACQLAQKNNYKYINLSQPGTSNSSITRRTIESCYTLLQQKQDFVVAVMWTFPDRYEFHMNYDCKEGTGKWLSFTPWSCIQPKKLIKEFHNYDKQTLSSLQVVYEKLDKLGAIDFIKKWYTHSGDSVYSQLYHSLQSILLLQFFCEKNNIPYWFTFADNSIWNTNSECDYSVTCILEQINKDVFFDFNGLGFYQWALENNYPVGVTHPLDSAHTNAVDLMEKNFVQVVQKNCSTN